MEHREGVSVKEALSLHRRGLRMFWRLRPGMFISRLVYAVIAAVVPYVTIYLSALLVGELAGGGDRESVRLLAAAILVSALVLAAASACAKRWMLYENAAIWQDKDRIVIGKLLDMDYVDMDSQRTHSLLAQIQQNASWGGFGIFPVPEYFESCLQSVISILCAVPLTAGLFLKKAPEPSKVLRFLNAPFCTVAVFGIMLGSAVLTAAATDRAWRSLEDCRKKMEFGNRVMEFFGYVMPETERAADMRIYNQQDISADYFSENDGLVLLKRLAKGKMGFFEGLAAVISVLLRGFIYLFVCLKAWAGAFGVGEVTQYIGAVTALYAGIEMLLKTVGEMRGNAPYLKTTFEFFDIPNKMYQGSLTLEKRMDGRYEIEFRDVSFHYPSSNQWVLRHVSFTFRVGERLAIVGENGSGKTTFIKLLCRLYDPTEGAIFLNGIDIRKYNYREYMSVFAIVFQDFQLLSCSLGENVASGKFYDKEKVRRCLEEAGLSGFSERALKGLETCLHKDFDKDGVEISGGEAQKIALARALYKDAPFIILDEPTAALDPVAEQEVYERFDRIAGGKTAVYISHRLSSCRFCDVIAVFSHGQIVQRGSHTELLAEEGGRYYELWHAQAQYYKEEQERREEIRRLMPGICD